MKLSKNISKTIDYYDKHSEEYSKNIAMKPPIEYINKFADLMKPKGKVLDVGCAAGRDSRELISKGFSIVGIDLSEGLLSIAKEKDKTSKYLNMDMRELAFPNNTFHGIYATASLLHLETDKDLEDTLNEFNRVLKDSGILHIKVKEQMSDAKSEFVSEKLSNYQPRFFRYYKKEEIEKAVQKAKFEIIDLFSYARTDKKFNRKLKWISIYAKKLI